jgi:branched-chain amino acid aminotransferase
LVADECFLTGSAAEVIPVISIDGRPIGDGKVGPITTKLMTEFKALVHR